MNSVNRSERQRLARRMVEYYRTTPSYFDEVQAIAAERPSGEELVLFRALARLRGPAPKETRVLELGCGRCETASTLLDLLGGGRFSALEASPAAVAYARARYPEFDIKAGDITQLPYPDETFDVVFLNYVLEHTCEPDKVLDEAIRVMRQGALLGMIVPVGDLPWMVPPSLRHRARQPRFLISYAARRWVYLLRLRYVRDFFAFPLVTDPIVLARPGEPFLPDDDQVYDGSTLEITKYLRARRCEPVFTSTRDVSSYIRNGRRKVLDVLRTAAFLAVRASVGSASAPPFTTVVTLVARKASG